MAANLIRAGHTVTGVVAQLVAAARAQGHGSLDHSALLKVVEQLSSHHHFAG